MVLGGYARRDAMGEQTFVPPEDQGQAGRTKGDTTSGCADHEGGRTPPSWTQGVPLRRRIYSSANSPPWPPGETGLCLPAASHQAANLLVVKSSFSSSDTDDILILI
jgi:hypothetical protein